MTFPLGSLQADEDGVVPPPAKAPKPRKPKAEKVAAPPVATPVSVASLRTQFAVIVGASREMVSRVMKDLEDRGMVETQENGSVIIKERLTG